MQRNSERFIEKLERKIREEKERLREFFMETQTLLNIFCEMLF